MSTDPFPYTVSPKHPYHPGIRYLRYYAQDVIRD